MSSVRNTGEIRRTILKMIFEYYGEINVKELAELNNVTPQSIYRQINTLISKKMIAKEKNGRHNIYKLLPLNSVINFYNVQNIDEDTVFKNDFAPMLNDMSKTVYRAFSYIFTEMLNNVIEHSEATLAMICFEINAYCVNCKIFDNGIGIFEKISKSMNLSEKKFAILELAKGKFTTDPNSHTGEGVFFSSKIADRFCIESDNLLFLGAHNDDEREYIFDTPKEFSDIGTMVDFDIVLSRTEEVDEIMNKYTNAPDDYGFSKTVIPVKLLEYKEENPIFVSRSQAKRLYARFENFEYILLDFEGVSHIGQGFADELFRVFQNTHPSSCINYINANASIESMIKHVLKNRI